MFFPVEAVYPVLTLGILDRKMGAWLRLRTFQTHSFGAKFHDIDPSRLKMKAQSHRLEKSQERAT
jgi:hypothetical protein